MIEAKNISKIFNPGKNDEVKALTGISLEIREGCITAVTGRSGSGKSTLLYVISGLLAPSSGEVYIDSRNICGMTEKETAHFRNEEMGFIFQSFYLEKSFRAWENAALPLMARNVKKSEQRELAYMALERVGMLERAEHMPSQLSGGEQQRVSIARALVSEPKFIFADEPTGNLDKENGQIVINILKELAASGSTVVLVTHDMEDAAACDRILQLSNGAVISDKAGIG